MALKDFKDLNGKIFTHLTVVSYAGQSKAKKSLWLCKCICGKDTVKLGSALISGHTRSCGCLIKMNCVTHGATKTRLYGVWEGVKGRCLNPNNKAYKYYGGRGISVISDWANDFKCFRNWALENGYKEGLTLERKDNDKGYSPDNCIWATMMEQSYNRYSNIVCNVFGDKLNVAEVSLRYNLSKIVVRQRTKKGWVDFDLIKPLMRIHGKKIRI